MKLPFLDVGQPPVHRQTIEFKGYSDAPVIEDGEMREMTNLSSDMYPLLSQRKPRSLYSDSITKPYNIKAWKDKLAVIDGKTFFYGGLRKGTLKTEGEKILAPINSRLCIFPDKICYNIMSDRMESLEAEFKAETAEAITVTKTTITIPSALYEGFKAKDTVILSGFTTHKENNLSARIVKIEGDTITFPENTFTTGEAESYVEAGKIVIARPVPDMDFVIESNNRLWGCKGNSIYSCKMGDPTNWNDFTLLANSAFQADVGTDGDFTGVMACPTHIAFFKEDYIHRLFGNNKPSTYQIDTINGLGLQKGCHKSLVVVDGIIYYKSREGIIAYDGSYPTLITQNFRYQYNFAVAGTNLMKYYVSMRRTTGEWDFFAYDLRKRLWHREDNTHASMFTFLNGELLFINADKNKVYIVDSDKNIVPEDKEMPWDAVFGDFDEMLEHKKIYSKMEMLFEMAKESSLSVYISVDDGKWEEVYPTLYTAEERTAYMPIIPRRCEKFKIKLAGKGRSQIESLVRIVRKGSAI